MRNWLALLLVCALAIADAHALAPTSVTIQGRLADAASNPRSNATVTMAFSLHDAQVGGNALWSGESQVISTDAAGLWTARVGAVIPLNQDLFGDTSRWLEITVDDGNVVTPLPRVRLVTSPFAFRVGSVDGAYGGTILSKVTIGTGHQNSGASGFVAGENNGSYGDYSTIDGGLSNVVLSNASVIGGGVANTTQGDSVTIGGGAHNTVNGVGSTIGGGARNASTGEYNVVAGGTLNNAFLPSPGSGYSVIAGGSGNIIAATTSVIGGGANNRVNAALGTIAGGSADTVNGASGTVGGGYSNVASGDFSTIAGGSSNDANLSSSTVGGGNANRAIGLRSTVGGGFTNSATGTGTTVSGGENNSASGSHASVAGGFQNRASGSYSFASGYRDSALADYSTAMGQTASARHENSFAWGDGVVFLSTDTTNQFKIWATNGVRFAASAGSTQKIRIGDRFRDNGIIAWGEINSDGSVEEDFGIASVQRLFTGNYRVSLDLVFPVSVLIPVVSVDLSAAPNSAANARLAYVTNVTATSFDVVITTGAYVDVDEKFRVIVTAR